MASGTMVTNSFYDGRGRWTIPDWSAKAESVPYARLNSPQSLNLYEYVLNNPLGNRDLDGHRDDDRGCRQKGDAQCPVEPAETVAVDPGHGDLPAKKTWLDPGAVDGAALEKDYALKVANALTAALRKSGYGVVQTRTGDARGVGERLQWRVDIAKKAGADAFISIHMDAGSTGKSGMLVLYGNEKSKALAQNISDANTVMDNRGIASRPGLFVLKYSGGPSALVEVGFINNASDRQRVNSNAAKIGGEIASGIVKTFQDQ